MQIACLPSFREIAITPKHASLRTRAYPLLAETATKPVVGSGNGIAGPKLLATKPVVGSGIGIPGPAKAAEVLTVRAAMAARRTRLSFIDVLLDAK